MITTEEKRLFYLDSLESWSAISGCGKTLALERLSLNTRMEFGSA